MEKLRMKCGGCNNQERDVIKVVFESGPTLQTIIYYFSCGHQHINQEISEFIGVQDFYMMKYKDSKGNLLSEYKTKISGKTKMPTRETIEIDHKNKSYRHIVEEQNEKGEWKIVHSH
jgi:hypothetical protein